MSDKIPTKDDGSPDWRVIELAVYGGETLAAETTPELMRAAYIAALERCAQWHEGRLPFIRQQMNDDRNAGDTMYAGALAQEFDTHKESADTIRQWIEKEQADG